MEHIHQWWSQRLVERFWLGVVRKDGDAEVLATPCDAGDGIPEWRRRLIMHVKPGDMVFHFDEVRQAIVAWSISRGRARDCRMAWGGPTPGPAPAEASTRLLPTWSVELEKRAALDEVVPLDSIARAQAGLFPMLRALEDEVGDPLYYPFAINGASGTSLLAGYVFKLPTLFVEGFAPLASAAVSQQWFGAARATIPAWTGAGARTTSPRLQVDSAMPHSSALPAR